MARSPKPSPLKSPQASEPPKSSPVVGGVTPTSPDQFRSEKCCASEASVGTMTPVEEPRKTCTTPASVATGGDDSPTTIVLLVPSWKRLFPAVRPEYTSSP